MLIFFIALATSVVIAAGLSFGPIGRSRVWSATVTPLASIIGSGFLICGPLLAKEFGGGAALAMGALLALAYALGGVMRFNIKHLEPLLAEARFHDPIAWCARVAQALLAIAYAVSVAYYLKLLAEFSLKPFEISGSLHAIYSKSMVTGLICLFGILAASGGHRRMERLAHASVSLKIGVIGGMLIALALYWTLSWNSPIVVPPANITPGSIALVLGLLVTVQGFETSRYLGHSYDAELRIRSMRYAQWLSSAIYVTFLLLLTPFLARASRTEGVAGILDIMDLAAPFMSVLVLLGAVASQLSAAVADSIGSAGLVSEVSRGRLNIKAGFLASGGLAVAVVWLTDPFQVVAAASRSFALYYAAQCVLALLAARRLRLGSMASQGGFSLLALLSLLAALVGAPAE